ncbi:MAG: helix-turn-helix transcriptional regulator [Rhizonema sp. NSF051]|nr:helix-turn-helix transcriptional regulator [Rhizonema sp. NSF051]
MTQNRTTSDALTIMHRRYYQGKPERIAALEEARVNDEVARKITFLREEEGFSQLELAELVGVAASVIGRLEDADYEGQSLAMLWRIAAALHKRVKIDFVAISHDFSEDDHK